MQGSLSLVGQVDVTLAVDEKGHEAVESLSVSPSDVAVQRSVSISITRVVVHQLLKKTRHILRQYTLINIAVKSLKSY